MIKKVKRYKALRSGLKSQYDGSEWKLGKWRKTDCRGLCLGFNCSRRIQDTMQYVKMEILAEVEVRGRHFISDDKETWEKMRVVKAWHWTKKDSIELAIYCAEAVLPVWTRQYPNDDSLQKAIEAVKAWINNPTEENLEGTRKASSKLLSSACIAYGLAEKAAGVAEMAVGAIRKPAWEAAGKAGDAAWLAARLGGEEVKNSIENWLKERVKTLTPYKEDKDE